MRTPGRLRLAGLVTIFVVLALSAGCTCRGNSLPGDPCDRTRECVPGSVCYNETCVGDGVLHFTLSWDTTTDLDLHVLTPNGIEVSWAMTIGDGGELDVDDCVAGSCTNPTGVHVENINFAESAPSGLYVIWVENYDGLDSADFTIETDTGDVFTGSLPPTAMSVSPDYEVSF